MRKRLPICCKRLSGMNCSKLVDKQAASTSFSFDGQIRVSTVTKLGDY